MSSWYRPTSFSTGQAIEWATGNRAKVSVFSGCVAGPPGGDCAAVSPEVALATDICEYWLLANGLWLGLFSKTVWLSSWKPFGLFSETVWLSVFRGLPPRFPISRFFSDFACAASISKSQRLFLQPSSARKKNSFRISSTASLSSLLLAHTKRQIARKSFGSGASLM